MGFLVSLSDIQKTLQKKNYEFFAEGEYNLNIVGIRTKDNTVNKFNDLMTVSYKANGKWILSVFPCTTDPGLYWLNNPMNRLGTAILKESQYRSTYQIGKHQGKYTALVQRKPVTVIRDYDRDSNHDYNSGREETGLFGINIHRASQSNRSINVDKWSAGCQVFADPLQYKHFIDICTHAAKIWGNSFTYTLLHERDFS